MTGRLKRANEKSGQVLIERSDSGKTMWVSPSIFSDSDQNYINQWIAAENFSNTFVLVAEEREGHSKSFHYELTLYNKSAVDFSNLYMDFRMFIKNPTSSRSACVGKDQFIGTVKAGETVTVKTAGSSLRGGQPGGIWVRIYGPTLDGDRNVLEKSYPEAVMSVHDWEEKPRRPNVALHTTSGGGPEYTKGMNYRYGRNGVEKDLEKAISFFEVSAEKGTPKALYWIGDIYFRGDLGKQDWVKAAEYFKRGFEAGWTSSGSSLGEILMKGGHGLEKDEELALAWWKDGADCEDQNCLRELAWYYGANPVASKRDGKLAADYADRMMDCGVDYFLYTGAAAAAYAEAGRFDYAVYLQQKIVDYINKKYPEDKHTKYRAGFQRNLERFQQGQALSTKGRVFQ